MTTACISTFLGASLLVATLSLANAQGAPQGNSPDPVMSLLTQGRDAMQRGNLVQAETLFRKATTTAPQLSDAFLGLGLVELKRGEMDDAAKSLTRATELNSQLQGAHLFLGIAQYQMGQGAPAAASLRAEIALDPANTEALTWLGIVELGTGHPEQATDPLDQAAVLKPKDPNILYYRARAHSLVAEAVYRELYALDPDSALVHRALAESLAASGQPEKAIAEYEAAIRKQPGNSDLYESLGEENQKIARFDAATKAYDEELKINPNSAIALYNLGKIEVETGKPGSGVERLRKADAAHAAVAPTDFYLGLGLAELGQNEEAAHWLEQSLANQPSPFIEQSAYYQISRVYQKLNRKEDAQRALARLQILKAEAAKNITQTTQSPEHLPAAPNGSVQP
jgi:tetratricopeptide (TPR) repeat protein